MWTTFNHCFEHIEFCKILKYELKTYLSFKIDQSFKIALFFICFHNVISLKMLLSRIVVCVTIINTCTYMCTRAQHGCRKGEDHAALKFSSNDRAERHAWHSIHARKKSIEGKKLRDLPHRAIIAQDSLESRNFRLYRWQWQLSIIPFPIPNIQIFHFEFWFSQNESEKKID